MISSDGATDLSSSAMAACPSLLDRSMQTLDERNQSLCEYTGKVLLVVNTASQCGYTPQYEGLEALYKRYQKRGLMVVGFPSNDFGAQEPGSNKEVAEFCHLNYGVSFPMFEKSSVTGSKANSLYATLAQRAGEVPRWNFHKYLIDRSGDRVLSFESSVAPGDGRLAREIERMLGAPLAK